MKVKNDPRSEFSNYFIYTYIISLLTGRYELNKLTSLPIVKLYTCLIFYEHLSENKPSNFPIPLVSEQHNYFTRGASAQQLLISFSRINIRKFCPTVIGKYYWNALPVCIRDLTSKTAFKKALRKYYLAQY